MLDRGDVADGKQPFRWPVTAKFQPLIWLSISKDPAMIARFLSGPSTRFRLMIFALPLVCLILMFQAAAASFAQSAILTGSEIRGSVSPDRRAELYRTLEKQTEWMQRQSAVLKTVVKLVGPSVVHIEADLTSPTKGPIEESGSGVVLRRGGRFYVLTNRHVIRGAALRRHSHHTPRPPLD